MCIRDRDNRIVDIKFKTYGCGAAIASSSMATEMVKGRTLDEADVYKRQILGYATIKT